jgi:hypothetical protein
VLSFPDEEVVPALKHKGLLFEHLYIGVFAFCRTVKLNLKIDESNATNAPLELHTSCAVNITMAGRYVILEAKHGSMLLKVCACGRHPKVFFSNSCYLIKIGTPGPGPAGLALHHKAKSCDRSLDEFSDVKSELHPLQFPRQRVRHFAAAASLVDGSTTVPLRP